MKVSHLVLLAFAVFSTGSSRAADAAPGFTLVKSLEGIDDYSLDANGLEVLLLPDHSAPVVTFGVAYRVGSRNEVTGSTGSTHLLEHLMFKGSRHFNGDRKNSLEEQLERIGAVYNANTWNDRTNYFETVGSDHLELAIRLESDRMRGLLLRETDRSKEMTVVRNEYERGKNNPTNLLEEDIYSAAYIAQPYHHPTIGWRSDIELVPIDKLRDFYNTFYWPNNATVTVVGDFDPAAALALVRKYYGAIPRAPHAIPQVYTVEPDQNGPRRIVVKRGGDLGVVAVGYKTPPSLSPDSPAIEVLTSILVEGKGSRLYRALTDKGLVTSVDADDAYFRDGSLDILFADLSPGIAHAQVEAAMIAEMRKIIDGGVTDDEVATAASQIVAAVTFQRDGPTAITARLEDAIAVGDWTDYPGRQKNILAVKPEDVRRVAKRYFVEDQSTTGWFVPVHDALPPSAEAAALAKAKTAAAAPSTSKDNDPGFALGGDAVDPWEAPAPPASEAALGSVASHVTRRKVAGIDLLSMKTGTKGAVTLVGSLDAGRVANPKGNSAIADLVGDMLDKGSSAHDKFALAQRLAAVGAELRFGVGGNTLSFTGKCLSKDLPLLLQTLAEELRLPKFDPGEFAKVQKNMTGMLLRRKSEPGDQASRTFSELVFAEGHPNYTPPIDRMMADVARTSVSDLESFYRTMFGPASLHMVLVGDVDDAAIDQTVSDNFTGWTGGRNAEAVALSASLHPSADTAVRIPDKTSVVVMIGQADGLKISDPDEAALEIATTVLGRGFSGHLMNVVRNQKGLTYGIYSTLNNEVFTEGDWRITATFAPALLKQGLEATRAVLRSWYMRGITEEELAYRKTNEIGQYEVGLATSQGLARELLSAVQAGLGPERLDDTPKKIRALKLAEVNGAIRRYLDPDRMVTVVAGTMPEGYPN